MGTAIVTLRIMPESPEIDLKELETQAMEKITAFADDRQKKVEITPVAFGLKSVNITFLMDESRGGTDTLEAEIETITGVQSVECTDVRRIIG